MHMLTRFRKTRTQIACLILSIFYVTLHQPLLAEEQSNTPPNVYEKLAQLHLPSLVKKAQQEEKDDQERQKRNTEKLNQDRQKSFLNPRTLSNVEVPTIGDVEKLKLLYNLFQISPTQQTQSLDDTTAHDLELLCGSPSDPERNILNKIDMTLTTAGNIELQKILLSPSTDITFLQQRQAAIKKLATDEKLAQEVENYLAQIKTTENELVWFWKQMDDATTKFFDQVYFGKTLGIDFSGLNTNEAALETMALWKEYAKPLIAATLPLTLMIGFTFLSRMLISAHQPELLENKFSKTLTDFLSFFYKAPIVGSFQQVCWDGVTRTKQLDPVLRKGLIGFDLTILAITAYLLYSWINSAQTFNSVSGILQQKMINIATYMNAVDELGKLVDANPELKAALPASTQIVQLHNQEANPDVADFMETLQTDTFQGEPSLFSNQGRVLASYKNMHSLKNNFTGALQAAGQLDAYLSIAKLYNSQKTNANATWSFVTYDARTTQPHLVVENFWHPMLNPTRVVTNSIELGKPGDARNGIVTGPNAGGKSTALKAITLAVVLGQTIGIAPARSMTITPFINIVTYLNIADSEGKESLFQAEINRAQALLNAIDALQPHQFNFVIMDEIFTGTNPEEGSAGAYGVAKNLAGFTNSMAIFATHFKVLTNLEKDTNGLCQNYKVSVVIEPNGKIKPTYLLEKGISDQKIALQMLQNAGFGGSIVKDAYKVLNRPTV